MMVRAIQKCFVHGVRRRIGDVFDYPSETLPKYLVPFVDGEVVSATSSAPKTHAGRKVFAPTQAKDYDRERNEGMRAAAANPKGTVI